jgi:hypothetical protein
VVRCAIDRLRAAVSDGNTRRSSGTHDSPRRAISCVGARVTSSPSNTTLPRRAGVRPRIARSVVVLPAPLGPSSATTSPAATPSETPNSTCVSP